MSDNAYIWIIAAIVIVVGAVIVLERHLEKTRREALARLALRIGFAFDPAPRGLAWHSRVTGQDLPEDAMSRCALFTIGRARTARNLLRGERSGTITLLFEYSYTVGSGKHQHTTRQTVAAFCLGDACPEFRLRPEHLFDKLGAVFGHRDINFVTNPEFSSRYQLQGVDEAGIRRAFQPGALRFLAEHPGWFMEAAGGWLIVYRQNRRVSPEQCLAFLDDAQRLMSLLCLS